jgi:hypothetical protein
MMRTEMETPTPRPTFALSESAGVDEDVGVERIEFTEFVIELVAEPRDVDALWIG